MMVSLSAKPTDVPALTSSIERPARDPLLEASYSSITKEELDFVGEQTGIRDEDALREHILQVQAEAFSIHPYPCIRRFAFIKMKLSPRIPAYNGLLKLGREREGAILLDIGCCFGNDVRKAVSDGFPVDNCVATDIHPEFWDFGHKLFGTTQETFPARFFAGDVFDPTHLEPVAAFTSAPATPRPDLPTLTSLNPLRGHVSAIHISAVFHLFSEEEQVQLARSLAGLLSPEPGSIVFGLQSGRAEKGFRVEAGLPSSHGKQMFCHSPESWRELWEGVFPPGTIRVDADVRELERDDLKPVADGAKFWVLTWCITRL
ncbi:hypothetical protein BD311DRAFT_828054 [Dichomitus squalens]|uniref:Methyltransferase domain-containing protein n=1 Tax=Dichomitus squalens TaxID=114155 RepID=A0A4Q9N3S4_9APHY|nr:hypothetical protein BD311DRAFT_828054 [Dichomitus squalens]TBU64653.1 hypothetical protein BD310DRAFT_954229 [Dichomitus squalens]